VTGFPLGTHRSSTDKADRAPSAESPKSKQRRCRPGTHSRASGGLPYGSRQASDIDSVEINNALIQEVAAEQDTTESVFSRASLQNMQQRDRHIAPILRWKIEGGPRPPWSAVAAASDETRTLHAQWQSLEVRDGILYRRFVDPNGVLKTLQVVVPSELRDAMVVEVHGGPMGGHFGRRRTAAQLQSRAYWPGWRKAVERCCATCDVCARVKKGKLPRQAPLQALDVNAPMNRLHIDLCGPFPKSQGKIYILTCVDAFSRYLVAVPLPNKETETVAEALVKEVLLVHGMARQLLSDQGPEFQSKLFREVMTLMHVTQLRTSVYHPSCNGRAERIHRTLHEMMAKLVADNQKDWTKVLPMCVFAYNVTRSEATGFSPYFLIFGRQAICPLDVMLETPQSDTTSSLTDFVEQLQSRLQRAFGCVLNFQRQRTETMKRAYDANVKHKAFEAGQFVYYYYPRQVSGRSAKWARYFTGPYKVERAINDVNYVIRRSPRAKPVVAHADKLKLYTGPLPNTWAGAECPENGKVSPLLSKAQADDNRPIFQSMSPRRRHEAGGHARSATCTSCRYGLPAGIVWCTINAGFMYVQLGLLHLRFRLRIWQWSWLVLESNR
jgi:transposase InsO family protein